MSKSELMKSVQKTFPKEICQEILEYVPSTSKQLHDLVNKKKDSNKNRNTDKVQKELAELRHD